MFTKNEAIISIVLIALLILLVSPMEFLMPTTIGMMLVISLIIVFAAYATFIWKENSRDERENLHRLHAGRIAYLSGSGVLVMGIVLQSINHDIDPWLIFTLMVMILSKLLVHIVNNLKH